MTLILVHCSVHKQHYDLIIVHCSVHKQHYDLILVHCSVHKQHYDLIIVHSSIPINKILVKQNKTTMFKIENMFPFYMYALLISLQCSTTITH